MLTRLRLKCLMSLLILMSRRNPTEAGFLHMTLFDDSSYPSIPHRTRGYGPRVCRVFRGFTSWAWFRGLAQDISGRGYRKWSFITTPTRQLWICRNRSGRHRKQDLLVLMPTANKSQSHPKWLLPPSGLERFEADTPFPLEESITQKPDCQPPPQNLWEPR